MRNPSRLVQKANDCSGSVLIELLLITPIMILMGFWTLSFTQVTRERAIASELASQAAQMALLHCSDEYMIDKSQDTESNPDIIDPNSSVAFFLKATPLTENCLDQIKVALESLSGLNDLPAFDVHLNVWRLPAPPAAQSYTRCFSYPTTNGENDLLPMGDDGTCTGAGVILSSTDENSSTAVRSPSLSFSNATGPAYSLVGGGSHENLTAANLNGFFSPELGKRMVIHAAVFLQSEAFDLTISGIVGAGTYRGETAGKWVVGQAII
jgi:hypothetical protein